MPGFYNTGDYDVAGTIVGSVDKSKIIDGSAVVPGHRIIGIPSSGLHTNGFSLARAVLFESAGLQVSDHHALLGEDTVGEALLKVHRSYLNQMKPLLDQDLVTGMAHITGGGVPGNLIRILPEGCGAVITPGWDVPPVFKLIKELGDISEKEMRRAFNLGAGFLVVTPQPEKVTELLLEAGEKPFPAGEIVSGDSIEYHGEGV